MDPAIARQYDLFQSSFDTLDKERQYLNYGFTRSRRDTYEERQQQLCLEVFQAAAIAPDSVLVDVGFGSGEQDMLLARTHQFARLTGFNIAERQVTHANERARAAGLDGKLQFRHGAAEDLPGIARESVDRVMAIECAFYFDRPRFYARAAEVLRPGGRLVLADIMFADRAAGLTRGRPDLQRVGTLSANRQHWEQHFRTVSIRPINRWTRPGAQMTVTKILGTVPFRKMPPAERREWLKMAFWSQLVALGLGSRLLRYDLIVLEKGRT
jgi:cyclopropane fatty-acyl-phospholipid synthase-like methyltransferase